MTDQMFNENAACPYTGGKKTCAEYRQKRGCTKHVDYVFTDGAGVDHVQRGCSDFFDTRMAMEQALQIRQLGGAIESLRNEVIEQQKGAVGRYAALDKQVEAMGEMIYEFAKKYAKTKQDGTVAKAIHGSDDNTGPRRIERT